MSNGKALIGSLSCAACAGIFLLACSAVKQTSVGPSGDAARTLETLRLWHKDLKVPFCAYGCRNSDGGARLKNLVGLSRDDIVGELGTPTYECKAQRDVAGCTRPGGMFYSFYPDVGELGGGPELSLSFNKKGRCVRAGWIVTQ